MGQVIGIVALHHYFFQHARNGELTHDVAVLVNEGNQAFHHVLERLPGYSVRRVRGLGVSVGAETSCTLLVSRLFRL